MAFTVLRGLSHWDIYEHLPNPMGQRRGGTLYSTRIQVWGAFAARVLCPDLEGFDLLCGDQVRELYQLRSSFSRRLENEFTLSQGWLHQVSHSSGLLDSDYYRGSY